MRNPATFVAAAVAVALLLVSCAPQTTLFPLFTPSDKTFDEKLLGEWKVQSGPEFKPSEKAQRMLFRRGDDGVNYDVTLFDFDDKGTNLAMTARLVALGAFLFIDFGNADPDKRKFNEIPFPVIEAHVFGRIHWEKQGPRIDFLNDEWITKQAKAGTLSLSVVQAPGGPLLSATTEQLRKFALEHAEDKEALSEAYSLVRTK